MNLSALEQRDALVLGLVQHAPAEVQVGQLAVEVELGRAEVGRRDLADRRARPVCGPVRRRAAATGVGSAAPRGRARACGPPRHRAHGGRAFRRTSSRNLYRRSVTDASQRPDANLLGAVTSGLPLTRRCEAMDACRPASTRRRWPPDRAHSVTGWARARPSTAPCRCQVDRDELVPVRRLRRSRTMRS